MKIGILTQPLHNNYGGLLQAYALQTILERMGNEVIILNRPMPVRTSTDTTDYKSKLIVCLKNIVKGIMGRPLTVIYHELTMEQRKVVSRFTDKFINTHHHKSPDLHSTAELKGYVQKESIEAYVVGSDQCWRPMYSPCITNYFLDFVGSENVKRIAYAASFGVDSWEYSNEDTDKCARLAKKFDGVSVREDSAIHLCKQYLNVNATHVLDPTMLLDKNDYNNLISSFDFSTYDIDWSQTLPDVNKISGKKLFCYILNTDSQKEKFIIRTAQKKEVTPIYCMPKEPRAQEIFTESPDKCTYPPVELWLQSFRDAEMVIADSFHGTVFSIIYNKPFWVLGNPGRGMARFHSLLKMFGLEDRLVTPDRYDSIDINAPINWDVVNARREQLKQMSLDFLKTNLK